jgi:ribosome-binding factor A
MTTRTRPARVAQRIQEEIARMLTRGLKDPRVGFVTVTGVDVTADLAQATVFYSVMGDEASRKDTQAGLEAARGFLRREISRELQMRHTPELLFKYDPSVEQGDRIERLLKEVNAKPSGEGGSKA